MLTSYNSRLQAIETVYTYEEWLREYNRREAIRRTRQRIERLYYIKQRLSGVILVALGILSPIILQDVTVSLFAVPLGIFLTITKEKVLVH